MVLSSGSETPESVHEQEHASVMFGSGGPVQRSQGCSGSDSLQESPIQEWCTAMKTGL